MVRGEREDGSSCWPLPGQHREDGAHISIHTTAVLQLQLWLGMHSHFILSNSIAFFNWLVLNRSVLILICSFPLPIAFLNIWLFSCACLQMWTYASNFLSSRSPIICEMRIGLSEPWGTLLLTSLHGELLSLRVTFWMLSFDKVLLSYLGVLAVVTGSFFFFFPCNLILYSDSMWYLHKLNSFLGELYSSCNCWIYCRILSLQALCASFHVLLSDT